MKKADLFFTAVLVPLDYLTLVAAASVAYVLRFTNLFRAIRPVTFDLSFGEYLSAVLPLGFVWLLIFALLGLYAAKPRRLAAELTSIIPAVAAGIAVILAIAFFSRELFESRFILLAAWILSTLFLIIERLTVRTVQKALRPRGIGMHNMVIIGRTKTGNALRAFFDHYPKLGYRVVAQYAEFNKETRKRIRELKSQNRADILFVVDPDLHREDIIRAKAFSDIEHLSFFYSAELFPGSAVQPIIHTFAGVPAIEVPKTPLDGWGAIYKRLFDIVVATCLILVTLPLQIITALALLLEREGGILFYQERVGQGGQPFRYFKFRSMVKDARQYQFDPAFLEQHGNDREGTPMFKLENDPRVTPVGKWIRAFSIDEIPEFYLVLFGHMSLVGPRPHMPEEVAQYKPPQKKVLTIKPGITGMAQVGGRASLNFNEEVALDMHYIQNWSPWLDFIILLKTPIVVLLRTGTGKKRF